MKYLRYRYELSERALAHHAKLSADAMIGKLLEMWSDWLFVARVNEEHPVVAARYGKDVGELRRSITDIAGPEAVVTFTAEAKAQLEANFLSRGDDGLLEYLRDWGTSAPRRGRAPPSRRELGCRCTQPATLQANRPRRHARQDVALSEKSYERFGRRGERRQLEERAARWVGEDLKHRWQLVVWLPAPKMRQKLAEVLVDYNGRINHLDSMAFERANDIYMAHKSLWGVSVYVPEEVSQRSGLARALLSVLGEELGIEFLGTDGKPVPGTEDIVMEDVAEFLGALSPAQLDEVRQAIHGHLVAAHGGERPTKNDLVTRARLFAEERFGLNTGPSSTI